MLHPSYTELIAAVNSGVAEGEEPVVNSRYSIVIAAAKRARQLIASDSSYVSAEDKKKPLSTAVDELYSGAVKILPEDSEIEEEDELRLANLAYSAADHHSDFEADYRDLNAEDISIDDPEDDPQE